MRLGEENSVFSKKKRQEIDFYVEQYQNFEYGGDVGWGLGVSTTPRLYIYLIF